MMVENRNVRLYVCTKPPVLRGFVHAHFGFFCFRCGGTVLCKTLGASQNPQVLQGLHNAPELCEAPLVF